MSRTPGRSHPALPLVLVLAAAALAAGGCGNGGGGRENARPAQDRPASTGDSPPAPGGAGSAPDRLTLLSIGKFEQPVHVTAAPGLEGIVVVEKGGRLRLARGEARTTLLDISGEVSTGSEQGLLGVAFHPEFEANDRMFVNYTDQDGDTRVVEYALRDLEAKRVRELLKIDQPYENHNGGHLEFGPDGMLWIGTGDGGAAGDPELRAGDTDSLLGKMLRIDVDRKGGGGRAYAIPTDNPLAAGKGRGEIWAIGLRNPWRYSFDGPTGQIYIGDVGQGEWEEIDVVAHAATKTPHDFGWNGWEGFEEYGEGKREGRTNLEPVLAYPHPDGCSVTGGLVYRGKAVPALQGWYVFADFCADWIRAFPATLAGNGRRVPDNRVVEFEGVEGIVSFGVDAPGNLYAAALDGHVYRITA